MLKHLSIKNYAIIDELEIAFHPHLNIITGETGAGKSILLGALHMILGKRADTSVLRDQNSKAVIEGTFSVGHLDLQDVFRENDLDYEEETIIRREIIPSGKSRAFVNDSPVTLEQIRELTSRLVDLHAQHETEAVTDKFFILHLIDHLSGLKEKVSQFTDSFLDLRTRRKKLDDMRSGLNRQKADIDYLKYQLEELDAPGLTEADGEALEQELNLLENAGAIQENIRDCMTMLEEGEVSIRDLFREVRSRLHQIAGLSHELGHISERFDNLSLELDDLGMELSRAADRTNVDEGQLSYLRERSDTVNRLLQKHHVQDVSGLIALREEIRTKLEEMDISGEDLDRMEAELKARMSELLEKAKQISAIRLKQIPELKVALEQILHSVGMPHAFITIDHKPQEKDNMNRFGLDEFELMFSANKGIPAQPLKNVASGGERSRLMLAVKSVMADYTDLPTMIFDEIDTGISGEVAARVGSIFKSLSKRHQIISITHLPQIAAQADRHLFVYKDHSDKMTRAQVRQLDREEQVIEIAKMLSGEKPGESALNTARELIGA